MKGKFRTITCIATWNSFFIAFAVGFNSRHLLVVDPSLPPVKVEAPAPIVPVELDAAKRPEEDKTKGEAKVKNAKQKAGKTEKGKTPAKDKASKSKGSKPAKKKGAK